MKQGATTKSIPAKRRQTLPYKTLRTTSRIKENLERKEIFRELTAAEEKTAFLHTSKVNAARMVSKHL